MASVGRNERIQTSVVTRLPSHRERRFEHLREADYAVTSAPTSQYNCFAWVLGRTDDWVQAGDPERLDVLLELLHEAGFETCENASFESDMVKVAVFADSLGPTHAARQLASERWTSKLGNWEDIEHENLGCLEGDFYGSVVALLRRPRVATDP